jgi:hypothetical protein
MLLGRNGQKPCGMAGWQHTLKKYVFCIGSDPLWLAAVGHLGQTVRIVVPGDVTGVDLNQSGLQFGTVAGTEVNLTAPM